MTYDDYMPYYEQWEKMWGVCGTNQGPLLPGFTNYSYPLPPSTNNTCRNTIQKATEALGYSPFPGPNALATQDFVNRTESEFNECMFDGWCGGACNYTCETGAKANSDFRAVPAAISTGKFELRTQQLRIQAEILIPLAKS